MGGTEYSWCKAVPGGTGITVLALHLTSPPDIPFLQNALHSLQISHPNLRSKLTFNSSTNTFSLTTPPVPHIQVHVTDHSSTSQLVNSRNNSSETYVTEFQVIVEHEMNNNAWINPDGSLVENADVLFATVYNLSVAEWAVVLRIHTAACDRTGALSSFRELLGMIKRGEYGGGFKEEWEVSLGIEDCVPDGKAHKPFWARGVNMLGYSLNSLRLAHLDFENTEVSRSSRFVRLKMNSDDTSRILSGCESRGIKLCGLLGAAGLIAARSSKDLPQGQWEKYSVATLTDCRSLLDPILTSGHVGFYHSAIINSHDIQGGENLWELAIRTYTSFADAKKNNKHFSDVADLNFLMCKAIDNPGLTPSAALRTSLISVFEDPVIEHTNHLRGDIGLEDYVGCASIHGVGPSIALFDTIRDGELDCTCVYPSPLHSRKQMEDLISDMKKILLDGCKQEEA